MIRFGKVYNGIVISVAGMCICGYIFAHSADSPQESNLPDQFSAVSVVYHRFGDSRYPSANTSVQDFEANINYLSNQGFVFSTASQVYANCNSFPNRKLVVITIDDGYRSFYSNGWEIFKKNKVRATLFINTESVGWNDYLTWEQIREISNQGIEIGHHSHAHTYFLNLSDAERSQRFEEDLLIAESLFEKHLGFIPKIYSYPYGEFDHGMRNVLEKHGYKMAFAQNSGVWNEQSDPLAIPRFPMAGDFVELKQFKSKVNMGPLKWQQSEQLPLIVNGGEQVSFKLKLEHPDQEPLNCFIAGQSRSEVFTKHQEGILVAFRAPENRRRTLITFTARDKEGHWYWGSRLVINPCIEE